MKWRKLFLFFSEWKTFIFFCSCWWPSPSWLRLSTLCPNPDPHPNQHPVPSPRRMRIHFSFRLAGGWDPSGVSWDAELCQNKWGRNVFRTCLIFNSRNLLNFIFLLTLFWSKSNTHLLSMTFCFHFTFMVFYVTKTRGYVETLFLIFFKNGLDCDLYFIVFFYLSLGYN